MSPSESLEYLFGSFYSENREESQIEKIKRQLNFESERTAPMNRINHTDVQDEPLINFHESEISGSMISQPESFDWNELLSAKEETSNSMTAVTSEMKYEYELIQKEDQSSFGRLPIISEDAEKESGDQSASTQDSKKQNERIKSSDSAKKPYRNFIVENIRNVSVKWKKQNKSEKQRQEDDDSDTEMRFFDEVKMLLIEHADNQDQMIERIDISFQRTTAACEAIFVAIDKLIEGMDKERESFHEAMNLNLSEDFTPMQGLSNSLLANED